MPRIIETAAARTVGKTDQYYTCRMVSERYAGVQGDTDEEMDMVDFFQQLIVADSRGAISSFVIRVMVAR